jgi:poly(3-hydroxybutyrate) depolymerase
MTRRRAVAGLAVAAMLVAAGALLALAHAQGSPDRLRARKGHIVSAEMRRIGEDAISTLDELTLRSSTGRRVKSRLRVPREGPRPHAGAVLLGGIKRGSRIVVAPGLEEIARSTVLVALDYPLEPSRNSWKALDGIVRLVRLRPAAFDTIADVLLLLDYLETRDDVARERVFLIGGSLGAAVVTVAGGVDPRPAAVVALYGAGRLGSLVTHTLEHPAQEVPYAHWQATLLGHGVALLLTPLEPARYAGGIAPRLFIMVNGEGDSLVPRENVLALYDAAQRPKELHWVKGEHVQPSETRLLAELSGLVTARLTALGLLDNR